MSSEHFPLEIVKLFVDNLDLEQDKQSLIACTNVSRSFRACSQERLFRTIKLTYPNTPTIQNHGFARPLLNILRTNPAIARSIRHFHVENFHSEGYWFARDDDPYIFHIRPEYRYIPDKILSSILGKLQYLKSFALEVQPYYSKPQEILSYRLVSSLISMFSRTKVAEIRLTRAVGIPVSEIAVHCPHLRRLSLRHTKCWSTTKERPVNSFEIPPLSQHDRGLGYLEHLELDNDSMISVSFLLDRIDSDMPCFLALSRLRELKISGNASLLMSLASKIITGAAETLEVFSWEIDDESSEYESLPLTALKQVPSLRSLRLAFTMNSRTSFIDPLPWLLGALKLLRELKDLEDVFIAYAIYRGDFPVSEQLLDWSSAFDTLLSDDRIFRKLRHVVVVDVVDTMHPLGIDEVPRTSVKVSEMFPKLRNRKMIRMESKTRESDWQGMYEVE
ncbi:hypothetical protein Hypma_013236 [Hypsizygus marmoreus]|uniref:F-box domain-containing protein n=1 Tax=Hypsizygus marmoreus TaxID=39966 RepID=A0A369JEE4_HYPMA|nr:hypothetical protein Hypma_013236 [Hypsizygus marmoreus]